MTPDISNEQQSLEKKSQKEVTKLTEEVEGLEASKAIEKILEYQNKNAEYILKKWWNLIFKLIAKFQGRIDLNISNFMNSLFTYSLFQVYIIINIF